MEIYLADIIETEELLPILNKYNTGLEVEIFSSANVLDNLDKYVSDYKDEFHDILISRNISIHGPFNDLIPASRDREIKKVTRNRFECAYKMACSFNAKRIIYHTGFMPKTYSPNEWLKNSIEFWTDFTKDKLDDMQIHIENVYEDDFTLMSELVESIDHPNFSICLDVGHINANSTKSLEYWINGLNSKIGHVHLHNNDGFYDNHYGLNKGNIDMLNTLAALKSVAPNASWTLEIVNTEDLIESLFFLDSNGFL